MSFDTVLAVRTQALTWFFLHRTCSCRLSSSLSSRSTLDQLVLSNTILQPNKTPSNSPECDVAVLFRAGSTECQTTACTCGCIVHSASALGLLLFWIRLCVSMMVLSSSLEFGHIVLDLFSPFSTRSPPRQPTSIINLAAQEPCRYFSRKAGQLLTFNKQPQPIITLRGEEKHPNKTQTNDQTKSFSAVGRRSVLSSPWSWSGPALQCHDFLSNSKHRYCPLTQPNVADCWPWIARQQNLRQIKPVECAYLNSSVWQLSCSKFFLGP